MEEATRKLLRETNATLATVLSSVRESLAGRRDFHVEDIRAIAEPIGRMSAVVFQAGVREMAGSDEDIKSYATLLQSLEVALERAQFMLLARRGHLDTLREHVQRSQLWMTAFQQTE